MTMSAFTRGAMTTRCRFELWSFLLLAATLLAGCHRTPDEQQVRQAIAQASTAARGNDADGVLDQVAGDFIGNDGELDRDGLRRMLAVRAFRHDSTRVIVGPVTIERQGDRLIADFELTLAGGKPDSLWPDQAATFSMRTAWRQEHGRWRCYSATWKQGP